MDERLYQQSRARINPSSCVFEKALLSGCAQCEQSHRHALAEREVVACRSEVARSDCAELYHLFRERATFALRLPLHGVAIAHNAMMKLQCGGLGAIKIEASNSSRVGADNTPLNTCTDAPNVYSMVQWCQSNGRSFFDLPWNQIVASIAAFQPRRRASRVKT